MPNEKRTGIKLDPWPRIGRMTHACYAREGSEASCIMRETCASDLRLMLSNPIEKELKYA